MFTYPGLRWAHQSCVEIRAPDQRFLILPSINELMSVLPEPGGSYVCPCLSPPVVPFYPFLGRVILSSLLDLLEDLVAGLGLGPRLDKRTASRRRSLNRSAGIQHCPGPQGSGACMPAYASCNMQVSSLFVLSLAIVLCWQVGF